MPQPNYYQTLGLDPNASYKEIRSQYRKLIHIYHPDRNHNLPTQEYHQNEEKFKKIAQAYRILSNSEDRKNYDQKNVWENVKFHSFAENGYSFTLSEEMFRFANLFFNPKKTQTYKGFAKTFTDFTNHTRKNTPKPSSPPPASTRDSHESGSSHQDSYSQLIRNVLKACNYFYKNKYCGDDTTKSNPNPLARKKPFWHTEQVLPSEPRQKVADIRIGASTQLSDIYQGLIKEITINRKLLCSKCIGRGYTGFGKGMVLCDLCLGVMIIESQKEFKLNLALQKIVFFGEGDQTHDKIPGDVIVKITPKDSKYQIINDYDLVHQVEVNFQDFYLGGRLEFETPDHTKYHTNFIATPELREKKQLVINELGLLISHTPRRGNLYLNLLVKLPDLDLNKDQLELLTLLKTNSDDIEISNSKNVQNTFYMF